MAVTAAATLPTLGRQPLSWDEAVTLGAAQRRPGELWALLHHTDAPLGFYYLLMHGWLDLLGGMGIAPTAGWLRLPSAVAAIGAVGLLVILASRWFDSSVALLAGLLLAVHPLLTFYAQDARPYTLVTIGYLAATWALLRALERPRPLRLVVYVLFAVATLYLHLFAVYAFAPHIVLMLRVKTSRLRWLAAATTTLLATIPLLLLSRAETGEIGWIPHPSVRSVASVVSNMFGGATLVAVTAILGVVALRTRPHRPSGRAMLVLLAVAAPVSALIIVDFFIPDLIARYALVATPAAAILVALAAVRTAGRGPRLLAVLILLVAATTTIIRQAQPFKYENYQQAADVMGDLSKPGDAVMFLPISVRAGFQPYRASEADLRNIIDAAALPGHPIAHTDLIGGLDRPPRALAASFGDAPRIFLLGDTPGQAVRHLRSDTDMAQQAVLHHYRTIRKLQYGQLHLTVLERTSR